MALRIKSDVDLKELEKYGYFISHVAVFPKKIVKQVDNEHIIARDVEYVPISCTDEDGNVIWTLNEEC